MQTCAQFSFLRGIQLVGQVPNCSWKILFDFMFERKSETESPVLLDLHLDLQYSLSHYITIRLRYGSI